jgi:hypothetical protein
MVIVKAQLPAGILSLRREIPVVDPLNDQWEPP